MARGKNMIDKKLLLENVEACIHHVQQYKSQHFWSLAIICNEKELVCILVVVHNDCVCEIET